MTKIEIQEKLLEIFGLVLKKDFSGQSEIVREEEMNWDSLKHLEIIFAVEDELGVRFAEENIPELKALSDFESAVERLYDAA